MDKEQKKKIVKRKTHSQNCSFGDAEVSKEKKVKEERIFLISRSDVWNGRSRNDTTAALREWERETVKCQVGELRKDKKWFSYRLCVFFCLFQWKWVSFSFEQRWEIGKKRDNKFYFFFFPLLTFLSSHSLQTCPLYLPLFLYPLSYFFFTFFPPPPHFLNLLWRYLLIEKSSLVWKWYNLYFLIHNIRKS